MFRRGLYAARELHKGDTLQEEDILLCRPTSELAPVDIDTLIGKVLNQDIATYQAFQKDFVC
jgi:sialic acid synthase SpsE